MGTGALLRVANGSAQPPAEVRAPLPSLAELYDAQFDFVWRSARRLGVRVEHLDDVVQEVFMVVHRRLQDFEGRSELRTWMFGITRRVVRNYRRTRLRRPTLPLGGQEVPDPGGTSAEEAIAAREEAQLLYQLLDELDDDKREVFVLAELEELPGTMIAEALALNLSTVYARLRAARLAFERALRRHRARQRGIP